MAVINRERFIELATDTTPANALKTQLFLSNVKSYLQENTYQRDWDAPRIRLAAVNREAAITMFNQAKAYLVSRGYFNGKGFRPWEVDDRLYAELDRSQVWWGFEFETGYVNHDARAEVLSDVWDRWDNVAFDSEGEGRHYCEITFAPQERSKFTDGTANAVEFMQYLGGSRHLVNNTGADDVGTHINMSHPAVQNHTTSNSMARVLNNTLHLLPSSAVRKELFGRSRLYGGFGPRSSEDASAHWLEGKLFRTTYDYAEFQNYLKVCEALTKCIEATLAHWETTVDRSGQLAISNLAEVVAGAEPIIVEDVTFIGNGWGAWINDCTASSGYEYEYDDDDEDEEYYDEGDYDDSNEHTSLF